MVLAAIVLWLHRSETRPGLRPVAGSQAIMEPALRRDPSSLLGLIETFRQHGRRRSPRQRSRLIINRYVYSWSIFIPSAPEVPVDLWHGWLPLLTLEWKDFPQGCRSGSRSFVEMLSGPDGGS